MDIYNIILKVVVFGGIFGCFFFLIYLTSRKKPLWSMRCEDCGCKDKDWKIVPTGHDDFGWQHNCKK